MYMYQGFIQEKNVSEKGTFTKIDDLKKDPEFKNYHVIFHTRSDASKFSSKLF